MPCHLGVPLSLSGKRFPEGLEENACDQGGNAHDESNRVHGKITKNQENHKEQKDKFYQRLNPVELILFEKHFFHDPPQPAKIKDGDPSTQY